MRETVCLQVADDENGVEIGELGDDVVLRL
jgi:hypothetical protein